jgi:hypothetical protein
MPRISLSGLCAVVTTAGAWTVALIVARAHPEACALVAGEMALVSFAVFGIERGVRHLDLKAGADGIGIHADGADDAPTVQVATTTTVTATPGATP